MSIEPSPQPLAAGSRSTRPALAPQVSWCGHHRATRRALETILQRAPAGDEALSTAERVLVDACELRRAAASSEGLQGLLPNCVAKLTAARFALNEIGAMSIAAFISEAMPPLRRARSRQRQAALLARLQRKLNAVGALLDGLLAKHAQSILDARDPYSPRTTWRSA